MLNEYEHSTSLGPHAMKRHIPKVAVGVAFGLLFLFLLIPHVTPLRFYDVTTGSMVPTIPVGSVVIVNTADTHVALGNIVAFHPPLNPTQVFTHRVAGINLNGSFRTHGDALIGPDAWVVPKGNVVGDVLTIVPFLGWFFETLECFIILCLVAWTLFKGVNVLINRRIPPFFLAASVLSLTVLYFFDILRPLISGSTTFIDISKTTVKMDVINSGWVPITPHSAANPHSNGPSIPPNSHAIVVLHFSSHAHIQAVIRVYMVPTLNTIDWLLLFTVTMSPLLMYALLVIRERRLLTPRLGIQSPHLAEDILISRGATAEVDNGTPAPPQSPRTTAQGPAHTKPHVSKRTTSKRTPRDSTHTPD